MTVIDAKSILKITLLTVSDHLCMIGILWCLL